MNLQELQTLPADVKQWKNTYDSNRADLEKYLRKYGFYPLGSGARGTVFEHPKRGVLKVFANDPGYFVWLRYCRDNQNNPYVPKILSPVIKFKKTGDIRYYAVLLEHLEPLSTDEDIKFHRTVTAYVRGYRGYSFANIELDANLMDVLEMLKGSGLDDDISEENIMKRGDQYVFTDPL